MGAAKIDPGCPFFGFSRAPKSDTLCVAGMNSGDYTADAICQVMGLSGFVEEAWVKAEHPTLRVLLTPAFHPELCITLSRTAGEAAISVVRLGKSFWARRRFDASFPNESENARLPLNAFEDAIDAFQKVHQAVGPDYDFVCADGMGSQSCLVSRLGVQKLRSHVWGTKGMGGLVACVIDLAWKNCNRPLIRNALAGISLYVNLQYPRQEVPSKPRIRMAVLGTPQERLEYLEMFRGLKQG